MRSIAVLCITIASLAPLASSADVLCRKPNRVLTVRPVCRANEQLVDPALLGLQGPQGPQGPQGAAGAQGPTGIRGPSGAVAVETIQGVIGLIPTTGASSVFIGGDTGKALITVPNGATVMGSAVANFGGMLDNNPPNIPISTSLCYQKLRLSIINGAISFVPDGPVERFSTPLNGFEDLIRRPIIVSGQVSSPYPVSSAVKGLQGTYHVGYCVSHSSPASVNGTYVLGWVEVVQEGN